jgi:phosphate:Na+ symporter
MTELSRLKYDRNVKFSDKAVKELNMLYEQVSKMMEECNNSYSKEDIALASRAAAREETIDELTIRFKEKHIKRLEEGTCSVQAGVIFLDVITHLERIADHLHNVSTIVLDSLEKKDIEAS